MCYKSLWFFRLRASTRGITSRVCRQELRRCPAGGAEALSRLPTLQALVAEHCQFLGLRNSVAPSSGRKSNHGLSLRRNPAWWKAPQSTESRLRARSAREARLALDTDTIQRFLAPRPRAFNSFPTQGDQASTSLARTSNERSATSIRLFALPICTHTA